MVSNFLESRRGRSWSYDRGGSDFEFYQGNGSSALEVVVVRHGERPTKEFLQRTYTDRRGGRANPILVVALYDDQAGLCGPSGEEPPVYHDVDRNQAEHVCEAALDKPDRHTAQHFLTGMLPQLDEELAGLRNQGLLSTHELRVGVPARDQNICYYPPSAMVRMIGICLLRNINPNAVTSRKPDHVSVVWSYRVKVI